jgi:uncharacterized protein
VSAARVAALDWAALAAGLDELGCALTEPLLSPTECRRIAGLYDEPAWFRSTIEMARHRFGAGQYRYFGYPLPDLVADLRAAFWPHLLPIARVESVRGWSAAPVRHGVSVVRSGRRRTLGLVLHDAQ